MSEVNQPKTVLVVDDEGGVREIIKFSLEAIAGWHVITADCGEAGINQAIQVHPDAIILDVMMPNMDGPTTFKNLQANAQTKNIPTILLTAKAQSSERQELMAIGVTGVLTKPFQPIDLIEGIKKLLNW
ncbi:MAG: response regulator [Microcoleaceae cyanobacterium]